MGPLGQFFRKRPRRTRWGAGIGAVGKIVRKGSMKRDGVTPRGATTLTQRGRGSKRGESVSIYKQRILRGRNQGKKKRVKAGGRAGGREEGFGGGSGKPFWKGGCARSNIKSGIREECREPEWLSRP